MKIKFPHSETQKEHEVKATVGDYYILEIQPMNWGKDCFVAVKKSAVSVVQEVAYKMGQRFMAGFNLDHEYILAQADRCEMVLISVDGGNRWRAPIKVADHMKVTFEEMSQIVSNQPYKLIS